MKTGFSDKLPRLQRREALGEGLHDVVRRCGEIAQGGTKGRWDEPTVHRVRQALKRARAVLRLGTSLRVRHARQLRRRLATLARQLSPLRDATVVARQTSDWRAEVAAKCRAGLDELAAVRLDFASISWRDWRRAVAAEMRRVGRLEWGSPTLLNLERALARSARRVRRRAHGARKSNHFAARHEWRKAVIVLREQVLVADPLLGRETTALHARLHDLAHELGRLTDLHVLAERSEEHDWPKALRGAHRRLRHFIRRKSRRAEARAWKCWTPLKAELRAAFG